MTKERKQYLLRVAQILDDLSRERAEERKKESEKPYPFVYKIVRIP